MHKYQRKRNYLYKYLQTKKKRVRLSEKLKSLDHTQPTDLKYFERISIDLERKELEDRINRFQEKESIYQSRLIALIKDLPNASNKVLRLVFIEGLSFDQIAKEIGYSERTARRYYSKGMDLLSEKDLERLFNLSEPRG